MSGQEERAGLVGFHGKQPEKTDVIAAENETSDEFVGRMSCVIRDGFVANMLAIGSYLGLFELMAEMKEPMTSEEIAKKGGFKERYIREWLGSMVCARVVDVTEDGLRFSIPEYRKDSLSGYHPGNVAHFATVLPMTSSVTSQVAGCFKQDGPAGTSYSDYTGASEFMILRMKMMTNEDLKKFIAKAPGMIEKLGAGIHVLELGGSCGHNSFQLAEMFPKSTFISADIEESEIRKGEQRLQASNLTNLSLQVVDACEMPADWSDKFDLVFSIDMYHDIPRADLAMSETFRVLKPGGALLFNDVNAHSALKDNCSNPQMSLIYSISILYCLPLSLNTSDSLGLGTAWGKERAIAMLKEAGFKNPQIVDENATDYVCIKE